MFNNPIANAARVAEIAALENELVRSETRKKTAENEHQKVANKLDEARAALKTAQQSLAAAELDARNYYGKLQNALQDTAITRNELNRLRTAPMVSQAAQEHQDRQARIISGASLHH